MHARTTHTRGLPRQLTRKPEARGQATSADVTASEIACYEYCAKAWHLEHVLHLAPPAETVRRRDAGIGEHKGHGRRVRMLARFGRRSRTLVTVLVLTAALAAVAAILVR
jgi:hypothetical protein